MGSRTRCVFPPALAGSVQGDNGNARQSKGRTDNLPFLIPNTERKAAKGETRPGIPGHVLETSSIAFIFDVLCIRHDVLTCENIRSRQKNSPNVILSIETRELIIINDDVVYFT